MTWSLPSGQGVEAGVEPSPRMIDKEVKGTFPRPILRSDSICDLGCVYSKILFYNTKAREP
jgi:hypothetical protein